MLCFRKKTYISDGFLGLVLSISCLLDNVINFTLDLNKVGLKLLLCVQQTCVLVWRKKQLSYILLECWNCFFNVSVKTTIFSLPGNAGGQHAHWRQPAPAQPLCGLSLSAPGQLSAPQSQPPSGRSCAPPWQPAPSCLPVL